MTVMTFPFLPLQFHVEFDIGDPKKKSTSVFRKDKEQIKKETSEIQEFRCIQLHG